MTDQIVITEKTSQAKDLRAAVGSRYGKPAVLRIEALRMHQRGFKLFRAENGVWLTDCVPASFVAMPHP